MKYFTKICMVFVLGIVVVNTALAPAFARPMRSAFSLERNFHTGKIQPVIKFKTRSATSAPFGLQLFCLKQPKHCRGGGKSQVKMTASLMKKLNRTNTRVNRAIRPRTDRNGDVWSINVKLGDCEDYVLTKRAALIKRGIPASALRIATAYTRRGEGHAVLVVRTDRGDFVLDNRRRAIKEWHKTDLRWVALSGTNLRQWSKV